MRLFRRVRDILTANLNDLVDRFEEPEVMLRQAIREMEDTVDRTTAATARAIAGERLLARERQEHEKQEQVWTEHARRAVEAGDDDTARQALQRKREHTTLVAALRDQWVEANENARCLRGQVDAMRAKLAEARRKLAELETGRRIAEARAARSGASLKRPGDITDGFSRFERLRHSIETSRAEASALVELYQSPEEVLRECAGSA